MSDACSVSVPAETLCVFWEDLIAADRTILMQVEEEHLLQRLERLLHHNCVCQTCFENVMREFERLRLPRSPHEFPPTSFQSVIEVSDGVVRLRPVLLPEDVMYLFQRAEEVEDEEAAPQDPLGGCLSADTPELAFAYVLDGVAVAFKEQVEIAYRYALARSLEMEGQLLAEEQRESAELRKRRQRQREKRRARKHRHRERARERKAKVLAKATDAEAGAEVDGDTVTPVRRRGLGASVASTPGGSKVQVGCVAGSGPARCGLVDSSSDSSGNGDGGSGIGGGCHEVCAGARVCDGAHRCPTPQRRDANGCPHEPSLASPSSSAPCSPSSTPLRSANPHEAEASPRSPQSERSGASKQSPRSAAKKRQQRKGGGSGGSGGGDGGSGSGSGSGSGGGSGGSGSDCAGAAHCLVDLSRFEECEGGGAALAMSTKLTAASLPHTRSLLHDVTATCASVRAMALDEEADGADVDREVEQFQRLLETIPRPSERRKVVIPAGQLSKLKQG